MDSVGHHVGAAADEHAERGVEMPRPFDVRREHEAGRGQCDASQDDAARPVRIDGTSDDRAQNRRYKKAERKSSCRGAAVPAELVNKRSHQQ